MPDGNLTPRRRIERRELISLFAALPSGGEVHADELLVRTGLDPRNAGDRNLIYSVREHCRDILGFVVEALPEGRFRRVPDEEIAGRIVERRRDRIYRQSVRGMAESVAVADFAALDNADKLKLLAHQSVFGAVALASHRDNAQKIANDMAKNRALAAVDPAAVLRAAQSIKQ